MIKRKLYRYSGRNGILTTCILLDGINHIEVYELKAEEGNILTNNERTTYSVIVEKDAILEFERKMSAKNYPNQQKYNEEVEKLYK